MSAIRCRPRVVTGTIPVGISPQGIAIAPNGRTAYVANTGSGSITPITLSPGGGVAGTPISVGNSPIGVAITPDGVTAYVANFGSGTVTPVTLTDGGGVADVAIAAGTNPFDLAITPDGRTAYVSNNNTTTVTPITLSAGGGSRGTPITVGSNPRGIVVTPDQAPTASFSDTPGAMGSATTFDGSASGAPEGSIVNYAWDFGDGSFSATNSFPMISHTYAIPGPFTVALTVTDTAGTSTIQTFTGTSVSNNGDSSARSSHAVALPPGITSIAPTGGSEPGGTVITISGSGFTPGAAVTFGATTASPVTYLNDATLVATSPAGTGAVDVAVTTVDGTSASGSHDRFTYSSAASPPSGPPPAPASPGGGFWQAASDGGIFAFGDADFVGSMGSMHLNAPIVGVTSTPAGAGYWMVASDGGIFTFGDATFHGSMGNLHLNRPIVGMVADASGQGYWMVASDGGIFTFGDATFHGSMGNLHLNRPIVGMVADASGQGYWMVASDGGIFTFGDATFHGSMGNLHLNRPIVGMAGDGTGGGYWLVASDGGIFTFGDAPFYGGTGGTRLNRPIVGMAPTPDGGGYWLAASDGGIFSFGDAEILGLHGGYASQSTRRGTGRDSGLRASSGRRGSRAVGTPVESGDGPLWPKHHLDALSGAGSHGSIGLGRVGQRETMGDDPLRGEATRSDQGHQFLPRLMHRRRRHAQRDTAEQGHENGEGIRIKVVHPDHRDGPPRPDAGERIVEGGVPCYSIDDRVGPSSGGGLHDRLHRWSLQRSGTGLRRQGPPAGHRVDGQDATCPEDQSGANGAETDGAQSEHHHRSSQRGVGPLGSDPTGVEIVGQQQRRLVIHPLGDGQHLEVRRRHGDAGGLPSSEHARTEHLWTLDAGDGVAGVAAVTVTAPGHRRGEHPVSDLEPPDFRTDLGHGPDEFVTDGEAVTNGDVAVIEVEIRPADGTGLDGNDRPVGPWRDRVGTFHETHPSRTIDDYLEH